VIEEHTTSYLNINSSAAHELRFSKICIIDEAILMSFKLLELLDRFFRDVTRNTNIPFGGMLMLLAGDFMQCLAIKDEDDCDMNESGENIIIKRSYLWQYFVQYTLKENMRALPEEIDFKAYLLRIGRGLEPAIDGDSLVRIPDQMLCEGNIVDDIYGEGTLTIAHLRTLNVALLAPTNKDSLEINDLIHNRLEGEERVYLSSTRVEYLNNDVNNADRYPIENAQNETPNGYPSHILKLRINSIIMLLRNWNVREGLCNGTRLRVTQMYTHSIRAAILTGPHKDKEFLFSRTMFLPRNDKSLYRLIRTQLPFRLAFAMTINKSQGQSFDRVGIILKTPCFAHGQNYVMQSRGRAFNQVRIVVRDILHGPQRQGAIAGHEGIYTRNVVDRSVFD